MPRSALRTVMANGLSGRPVVPMRVRSEGAQRVVWKWVSSLLVEHLPVMKPLTTTYKVRPQQGRQHSPFPIRATPCSTIDAHRRGQ